ncbi:hypothetical protein SUGI_1144840 [Cryptomeria japonica]|nr:hypothetical protein SUGI_1144840 [Cryptomeria japonica]
MDIEAQQFAAGENERKSYGLACVVLGLDAIAPLHCSGFHTCFCTCYSDLSTFGLLNSHLLRSFGFIVSCY